MRVALVYLGRRGGGAAYSRLMASALARRCELISVVSAQAENLEAWRRSGHALLEIPTYTTPWGAAWSFLDVRRHLRLAHALRKYAPEVIYYPMVHPWAPLLNALLPKTPKVLTLHDPVLHLGEKNPLVYWVQQIAIHQSARIIVLSRSCAPLVSELGKAAHDVDVVPHGEFSFYRTAQIGPQPAEHRGGNTLLFFGRISRYKGVDVLLEAFREIARHRPATRLVLAGSGDLTPYSDRIAALPNVSVVNRWIPDQEVYPFFARADVVVLPYIDGSQSGVLSIASACGLPVVASDVGGLPEQVAHRETGLLVRRGDVHALSRACLELLENPALRIQLGRNAAERAKREWSWDVAAARVLDSLRTAMGSHHLGAARDAHKIEGTTR